MPRTYGLKAINFLRKILQHSANVSFEILILIPPKNLMSNLIFTPKNSDDSDWTLNKHYNTVEITF